MIYPISKYSLISLLLFVCNFGYAQEKHSLAAHVHGIAEVTIAIEGSRVEIEFISPAINLVGFEYKAKSADDIVLVDRAQSILQRADTMFSIPFADCKLVEKTVDLSSLKFAQHGQDEVQVSIKHQHNISHSNHNDHNDVIAHYHYHCEKQSRISDLVINAFNLFSGITKIKAMWVNNMHQGASTLNKNNNVINLR